MNRTSRLGLALLLLLVPACAASTSDVAMHDGITAHGKGEYSLAGRYYARAIELKPKVLGAHNNLALLELRDDELTKALAELEAELERHDSSRHAHLNRALVLLRLQRWDAAAEEAEDFAEMAGGPKPVDEAAARQRDRSRLLLGLAWMGKDASAEDVRKALGSVAKSEPAEGDDTHAMLVRTARRALGVYELSKGETARGVELLTQADQKDDPRVGLLLVAAHLQLGEPGKARERWRALPADTRREPWGRLYEAHLSMLEGDAKEARIAAREVARDDEAAKPARASAHRILAALSSKKGDWKATLESLDAAIALQEATSKGNAPLWLDRAIALARLGRLDDARVAVSGVLRDHPEDERAKKLQALFR